jgi:hypothetical protein
LKVKRDVSEELVTIRASRPVLGACFMLDSCLAYSSTLKIKKTGSSETSVDFGQHGIISQKTKFFNRKIWKWNCV